MGTILRNRFVPLEDYFALDSETERERWEWRNGDVRTGLRGSGCRTFPSDQRVKVYAGSPYLYPDVSVARDPRYANINGLRTLLNPLLIVEILSPSMAQDDKGTKFMQYQTNESLTDYLLVDSSEVAVLHYRKEGEVWTPQLFEQPGDSIDLSGLGIALPLAEIYLDTGLLTSCDRSPSADEAAELAHQSVRAPAWSRSSGTTAGRHACPQSLGHLPMQVFQLVFAQHHQLSSWPFRM
jgi:Uma2 family endonuclease